MGGWDFLLHPPQQDSDSPGALPAVRLSLRSASPSQRDTQSDRAATIRMDRPATSSAPRAMRESQIGEAADGVRQGETGCPVSRVAHEQEGTDA